MLRSLPRVGLVVAVFGAAAVLTGTISAGRAQEPARRPLIADVVPQVIPPGSQSVPNQKIMSYLKTRAGIEYDPEMIGEDVRRLYETKLFADIRVLKQPAAENRVVVIFQLKELPGVIQEIVYRGAHHIKQDELESVTGLKKGLPLNPWAVQKARQAILDKYREKGRLSASVEVVEGLRAGDTRVVFDVTEGPVAKVGRIDFVGNSFVSGARLHTQVNSSRPFLGLLGGDYNPPMADADVAKLEAYYRDNGYHDVHVTRELSWDPSQRYVNLVFHIREGKRYRVADFQVAGVGGERQKELQNLCINVKKGDVYNQAKVEGDQQRIKDWIGYHGREATIQPVAYYPPDRPGEVNVVYEVQERPPARVGEIIVSGNEVTRQNVILRQVPLYPGQILTYPDLRIAERNLARLNIFQFKPDLGIKPTVTVLDRDDSEFKDVLIQVHEDQTGSLMFGLGVNSDAGFNGSIVLNERNFDITRLPTSFDDFLSGRAFRGAGQEFRVEAVPGNQLQRYTVSWREPFLFDSPYSLSVGGYYYDRIYNEYREERLGTRITVGRKLNSYWSASAGIRVEDVGVHDVPFYAPYDFQVAEGQNFVLGLRAGVTRDSRDSFLRPTEGSLLDLSFEQVLGDYTFPVLNVEGNKYWTAYQRPDGSGRHVLAFRSQLGWAGSNAPVFERFYAGGFRSMRGFEFRGVGPFDRGFNQGGDFMFLNSLEYQIPLLANDQVYAVAFVDSGTVESDVSLRNYRVAAGAGLRLVVPMLGPVPIALDFGFPIVKGPDDRTQVFSFWVGFFH
jgi:outer membrane protein assembly complex protein YaeT